jgi:hypothetical protein
MQRSTLIKLAAVVAGAGIGYAVSYIFRCSGAT